MFELQFYPLYNDDYFSEKPEILYVLNDYDELQNKLEDWKENIEQKGLVVIMMDGKIISKKFHDPR